MSANKLTYFLLSKYTLPFKTKKLLVYPIVFKKGVIYKKLTYTYILASR